ncbi:hypothetical protein NE172_06960 [Clostridium botulinum]|uniref:Uncharacterized protein n=1 Tax=Clostridium botulinum TaxID=1491 RepID=A0A6B4JKX5_CLOBO|nr:hypothetical protein [Clostridium botulinum]EES50530.1 hypothetical protein CLO_2412 [Clostridium botulinum E1 str. 'BoNT E Beluga']MBY6760903.1 hypothetical protein [Clostridium botulinum]MBY6919805.1 hypothetical protein [Clostridium botulinum]MCR1130690.1 hypothetical protein [Clostridium botulinum]NFJ57589.1 hypothetical protein [Clostridium botulinum]
MEKANIIGINYEPSDTIEKQGKKKDVDKYIKSGYYVKEHRNGYWVLNKPARLIVTLADSSCQRVVNMKNDVCYFYKQQRISEKLVYKFRNDINNGIITIFIDEYGNCLLS